MSDTITVQLSVSVDTLLTIIGGAMIVVTVVVISVVGKIIKLLDNLICQHPRKVTSIFQFYVSSAHVPFIQAVPGYPSRPRHPSQVCRGQ